MILLTWTVVKRLWYDTCLIEWDSILLAYSPGLHCSQMTSMMCLFVIIWYVILLWSDILWLIANKRSIRPVMVQSIGLKIWQSQALTRLDITPLILVSKFFTVVIAHVDIYNCVRFTTLHLSLAHRWMLSLWDGSAVLLLALGSGVIDCDVMELACRRLVDWVTSRPSEPLLW